MGIARKPSWLSKLWGLRYPQAPPIEISPDINTRAKGFLQGCEGAQDYDLALRCTEHLAPHQSVHIPRVLYHWRSHSSSAAYAGSAKNMHCWLANVF